MTSIRTNGAASITPKAFLTGREIGAMTGRALTLRMAGVVVLIGSSSFDTVPSHKPWRRPGRRKGLDQPAADMFGREGDALGLACMYGQRIELEGLPTIVEPVEQAEMMAMEVKDGRDR